MVVTGCSSASKGTSGGDRVSIQKVSAQTYSGSGNVASADSLMDGSKLRVGHQNNGQLTGAKISSKVDQAARHEGVISGAQSGSELTLVSNVSNNGGVRGGISQNRDLLSSNNRANNEIGESNKRSSIQGEAVLAEDGSWSEGSLGRAKAFLPIRSSQSPAVPFYLPGTRETGVMKLKSVVSDREQRRFILEFIDGQGGVAEPRDSIQLSQGDVAELQSGLAKLIQWSAVAQAEKIRKIYLKSAACFTRESCLAKGAGVSARLNFQIYENGSTGGQILVRKGQYEQPYNFSVDSLVVLLRYLTSKER